MGSVEVRLIWESDAAKHKDRLIMREEYLKSEPSISWVSDALKSSETVEGNPEEWIKPSGLSPRILELRTVRAGLKLNVGQYYPRFIFSDIAEGSRDMRPCKVTALGEGKVTVDLNHPLSERKAKLVFIRSLLDGARLQFTELFSGPGIQVPPPNAEEVYLPKGAVLRNDENNDKEFYSKARLVYHLDSACRAEITRLYSRFINLQGLNIDKTTHVQDLSTAADLESAETTSQNKRFSILDLMSSWASHLPEIPRDIEVVGLGLNEVELKANPILTEYLIHDLNTEPGLPFSSERFDLVVCTSSVEYMTKPKEVFAEVKRILKPEGKFVITFSDRWFEPKVIRIWRELHPFERLGMVVWLLKEAGFKDINTETVRGIKRPEDDPYIRMRDYSDPLFAAWATT